MIDHLIHTNKNINILNISTAFFLVICCISFINVICELCIPEIIVNRLPSFAYKHPTVIDEGFWASICMNVNKVYFSWWASEHLVATFQVILWHKTYLNIVSVVLLKIYPTRYLGYCLYHIYLLQVKVTILSVDDIICIPLFLIYYIYFFLDSFVIHKNIVHLPNPFFWQPNHSFYNDSVSIFLTIWLKFSPLCSSPPNGGTCYPCFWKMLIACLMEWW